MDSNENPIAVPPQEDLTEVRRPTSLLVAQFFLFPLIIIAFGVGIFVLFGYIAYEEKSPAEYLNAVRAGGGYFDRSRWQAAAQLSNLIAARADELKGTPFADEVLAAYMEARPGEDEPGAPGYQDPLMELLSLDPDEAELRRFLAVSLGHLEHRPAVPALIEGLGDPNAETQIWTLWALGKIGDPAAAPEIAPSLEVADSGVRQMAAYVLGVLGNPAVIGDLQIALNDVAPDVGWYAAIALAQMQDASGSDLLLTLTDRAYFESFEQMSDEDKENVMLNAVHSLGLLKLEGAKGHLAMLSEADPSLKVRDAALAALERY